MSYALRINVRWLNVSLNVQGLVTSNLQEFCRSLRRLSTEESYSETRRVHPSQNTMARRSFWVKSRIYEYTPLLDPLTSSIHKSFRLRPTPIPMLKGQPFYDHFQTIICATPWPPSVLLPTKPCPLKPAIAKQIAVSKSTTAAAIRLVRCTRRLSHWTRLITPYIAARM